MFVNLIVFLRWTPEQVEHFDLAELHRAQTVLLAECALNGEGGIRHGDALLNASEVRRIVEELEDPSKREGYLWLMRQPELSAYLVLGLKGYFNKPLLKASWPCTVEALVSDELSARYSKDLLQAYVEGKAALLKVLVRTPLPMTAVDRERCWARLRQEVEERVVHPLRNLLAAVNGPRASQESAAFPLHRLVGLLESHIPLLNALPMAFQDIRCSVADTAMEILHDLQRWTHLDERWLLRKAVYMIAGLRLSGDSRDVVDKNLRGIQEEERAAGLKPGSEFVPPTGWRLFFGNLLGVVLLLLFLIFAAWALRSKFQSDFNPRPAPRTESPFWNAHSPVRTSGGGRVVRPQAPSNPWGAGSGQPSKSSGNGGGK